MALTRFKIEYVPKLVKQVYWTKTDMVAFRLLSVVNHAENENIESLSKCIIEDKLKNATDDEKDKLMKSLDVLVSYGVKKEDILKYSDILIQPSCEVKLSFLTKLENKSEELLPLLTLSAALLQAAAKRFEEDKCFLLNCKNRFLFLQKELEIPMKNLINLVTKHPIFLTLPFLKLQERLEILKEAQISTKHIVKDAWILNYDKRLLLKRLQVVQKNRIPVKPWLLRCSEKWFEKWISKYESENRILEGKELDVYLAERLNCSTEYIKIMVQKNTLLPTINVQKLKEIIDYLYEKGYTAEEIRLFPKIFCCSLVSIQKRHDQYLEATNSRPTIPQLGISSVFRKSIKLYNKL